MATGDTRRPELAQDRLPLAGTILRLKPDGSARSGSYGRAEVEGRDGPHGHTDPFVQWHTDVCSPSAVAIVNDQAYVAALRGESLWQVDLSGHGARGLHGTFGRIRMVKRAPDRSLWIGTSNGGGQDRIVRITRH